MNVVIYARYSSHNQTECSIEGQLEVCKKYAKDHHYTIIGEYIDRAKTGTKTKREAFQKMIKDSEKGAFQGILVYQLDRFARDRYSSAVYKKQLQDFGVRVYSAKENISDDASGILMESVLEGMAEYYSIELGQKVRRGMSLNAECFYYNGGTVPLGLKLESVSNKRFNNHLKTAIKKRYAIDADTAPIVEKIFNMYADGKKMADIIRYLNSLNLKTAYNKPFTRSSIRRILENKKYIGVYTYHNTETPNAIPRIISDDLFKKVQQELTKNGTAPSRRKAKAEYLLTSKLYCGECGEKITGYSGTSKTGTLYTYYSCKTSRNHKCNLKAFSKDKLEDIIVDASNKILTNDNIHMIAKKIIEFSKNEKLTPEYKRIVATINDYKKQEENILDSLSQCENDELRERIFQKYNDVVEKQKELDKELTIIESNSINLSLAEVMYYLKSMRTKKNITEEYKRSIINNLIKRVDLYNDKIVVIYNIGSRDEEIEISLLNNVKSSLFDADALPFRILKH